MYRLLISRHMAGSIALRLFILMSVLASLLVPAASPTPARAASVETSFRITGPVVLQNETKTVPPRTETKVSTTVDEKTGEGKTVYTKTYLDGYYERHFSQIWNMTIELVPGARQYQIYVDGKPWHDPRTVPADKQSRPGYTFGSVWGWGEHIGPVKIPNTEVYSDAMSEASDAYNAKVEALNKEYKDRMEFYKGQETILASLEIELKEKLAEARKELDEATRGWQAAINEANKQYAEEMARQEAKPSNRKLPLPNFTKVEALGIPVTFHLGGTIEVPAQPAGQQPPYRITLEGCFKGPPGSRLEPDDIRYPVAPYVSNAPQETGFSKLYTSIDPPALTDVPVDSNGRFQFILEPGSARATFQVVTRSTRPTRPSAGEGQARSEATQAVLPQDTLTVKIVDPKAIKERLTRYVDPACGKSESEEIASSSITISSPQKQFDFPYGYLDWKVEYANPSQTAALKGAALVMQGLAQTITVPLGDIAAGGRGAVNFRLEMQEKGFRLLADGKEQQLSGVVGDALMGSQGQGLWKGISGAMSKAVVTFQASLTASGVEPAVSQPLQVDVVDWNKRVSEWARLQRRAMFGEPVGAQGWTGVDMRYWLDRAYRLANPEPMIDSHGSGVSLANDLEALLRRWLPALDKLQAGQVDTSQVGEVSSKLTGLIDDFLTSLKAVCTSVESFAAEFFGQPAVKEAYWEALEKDYTAPWIVLQKHAIPSSPPYKTTLEKWGISPQGTFRQYSEQWAKLSPEAKGEILEAQKAAVGKLPRETLDELRAAFAQPNVKKWEKEYLEKAMAEWKEKVNYEGMRQAAEELSKDNILEKALLAAKLETLLGKDAQKEAEALIALAPRLERYNDFYAGFVYQSSKSILPSLEKAASEGYKLALELRQAQSAVPAYQDAAQHLEQWADYDTAAARNLRKLIEHTDEYKALDKGPATDWRQKLAKLRTPALSFPENPPGVLTTVVAKIVPEERLTNLDREVPQVLTGSTLPLFQALPQLPFEEQLKVTKALKDARQGKVLDACASYGLIDINLPLQPQQLQVSVASPVALSVTDDQGRRTGIDPATGKTVLQIPGATYSGKSGEPQSVAIPWPSGSYQAQLVGTGKGEYHLTITGGLPGQVALSQQGEIQKGQTVVADVAMVAVSDAEVRPVALISEAPAVGKPEAASEAQKKQASETPWTLWASVSAGLAILILGAGLLVWRRRARSMPKG
ncbi:MAG: hypothetical protein HYX82_05960 [Chloroflexi bacterium]|nr:hypothetical protein [Chloroflexota bacterium]